MKRGTPRHPKTLHLATLLELERWGAVGVLESLWHFTAHYAPSGDVGRHGEQTLAEGIGWRGDPRHLVAALVAAKWLERCRCHGLRVHDWPHHADQTVKRSEVVKREGFLGCYGDASSVLAACSSDASQPPPEPTPTPEPEPTPDARVRAVWPEVQSAFADYGMPRPQLTKSRLKSAAARLRERPDAPPEILAQAVHGRMRVHQRANGYDPTQHLNPESILRPGNFWRDVEATQDALAKGEAPPYRPRPAGDDSRSVLENVLERLEDR